MGAYAYLAIHDTAAIAAGAYLATNNCPWWAALCFALAATTNIRGAK